MFFYLLYQVLVFVRHILAPHSAADAAFSECFVESIFFKSRAYRLICIVKVTVQLDIRFWYFRDCYLFR